MNQKILLDTNILIGIVNNEIIVSRLPVADSVFVSAMTVMELYALAGMPKTETDEIDILLSSLLQVVPVSEDIARRAGELARTRPRRGKPDLLIAASAIHLGATLITQNIRDFKNIPSLSVQTI